MMLRLAVVLAISAVCFAQTPVRPKISETFTSAGEYEVHQRDGTFFGTFVLDRDQTKKMAVENATGKADDVTYHHEVLELYSEGKRYTVRQNGNDEPHCQVETITGNMTEFWSWVALATYVGKETYHEVVYDMWAYEVGASVRLELLVAQDAPDIPVVLRRIEGGSRDGFAFRTFSSAEPPASDFTVPKACAG